MGDFNAISSWDAEERPDIVAALRAHPKGMNLVPEGGPRVIAQMEKAGYVDAYRLYGEPGARSLVVPKTPIRIDYVFVSKPMADGVRDCDHLAGAAGRGSVGPFGGGGGGGAVRWVRG